MIPDWPSLWAREPGLRPEGLIIDDGQYSHTLIPTHDCDRNDCDYPSPCKGDHIGIDIAAAICRDAAVRWLIDQKLELVTCIDQHGFEAFDTDNPFPRSGHPTLDAALFAACVAVLDARDKA